MATDIRYLKRMIDQMKTGDEGSSKSMTTAAAALVTRDLLGGCAAADSTATGVFDLRSQAPSSWERHIDPLKSDKVYSSRSSSPSFQSWPFCNQKAPPKNQLLNLLESKDLDRTNIPSTYQSTCTLDKVKSALERAEKEGSKKRTMSSWKNSSNSRDEEGDDDYTKTPSSFAAGCPSCMMYVLISKNSPKCPRCHTVIDCPVSTTKRKHCIDLNMSI